MTITAADIRRDVKEKDIKYSTDGLNFIGDLVFDDEE